MPNRCGIFKLLIRMIQVISIARRGQGLMVMPVIIVTPSFVLLMHLRLGEDLAAFCTVMARMSIARMFKAGRDF
jgi:hypothetical protein